MGRSRVRGLRCRRGRLRCLEGQAGKMAHLFRAPDPGLAHRNKTLPSDGEKKIRSETVSGLLAMLQKE